MIQVVKYKCCGAIFAACYVPHCYENDTWLTNLKEYELSGDIIEMVDNNDCKFGQCECTDNKKGV